MIVRMSRRRRYSGTASFPWALPVAIDALGLVAPVTIGGHKVTMTFPILGDNLMLRPSRTDDSRPLPSQLLRAFEGRWGYKSSERSCYVSAASISLLLPSSEELHDSEDFRSLSDAFWSWFTTVQEWAAAWCGIPLGNFDDSHRSALHIAVGKEYLTSSSALMRTLFIESSPLSRIQLINILRRASRGERLPTEHQLLLSAADAQLDKNLRRAVIDAATAAEVALASYITDALVDRGLEQGFIDEMVKDVNGIANLHALCTRLGGSPGISKNKLTQELANVRNLAAHAGRIPTLQEATVAREHAITIVRALRPLPQL